MNVAMTARVYGKLGWSVIPVGTDKRPHFAALKAVTGQAGWKQFRFEPATLDEIHDLWEFAPDAAVAVLTGCSGDLLVADFDKGARPVRLPVTPIARSGSGGLHVYLTGTQKTQKTWYGDLLGAGSYVVLPPSTHPSGGVYEWAVAPQGLGHVFLPDAHRLNTDESQRWLDFVNSSSGHGSAASQIRRDYPYSTCEVGVTGVGPTVELTAEQAERALDLIGIQHRGITRVFCPFHGDHHASAGLIRNQDGGWVFTCKACGLSHLLGVLYARTRGARPNPPTAAKWWNRLRADLGIFTLPDLSWIQRPVGPDAHGKLAEGFLLFLALEATSNKVDVRDLTGQPFARSFGAPWCGTSEKTFTTARGALLKTGWLRKTGEMVIGRNRTNLFLPAQLADTGLNLTRNGRSSP